MESSKPSPNKEKMYSEKSTGERLNDGETRSLLKSLLVACASIY